MAPTSIPAKTITLQVGPSLSDPAALTEFRQSAAKDASNWNSLLRWHRRNRGPQWDYSTAMYQVDQGSPEYYAGPTPYEAPTLEEDDPKSPEPAQSGRQAIERSSPQRMSGSLRSGGPALVRSTTPNVAGPNLPPMPQPQSQSNNLPAMPAPLLQQSHQPQQQIPPQYYQQYHNQNLTKQPRHPGMLQKSP